MSISYTPNYANGWQDNEEGDTPITAATLNHIEDALGDQADAINELNTSLSGLVQRRSYTHEYSGLAAGGALNITGADFGIGAIAGYTPMALYNANSGHTNVLLRWVNGWPSAPGTVMAIRNVGSSAAAGTATIGIIFIRSSAME